MEHRTYTKINTLYKRYQDGPLKNCIIVGEYSDPETEFLKDVPWDWYEKIDGTNVSVYWDGHDIEIHGKSENATLHPKLIEAVKAMFPAEKLQEVFPVQFMEDGVTEKPLMVRIYGEGHGGNIQGKCGKAYAPDGKFLFRIFDIFVNSTELKMEDVKDIAQKFGVETAPFVGTMTVTEAEELVKKGFSSFCTPAGAPAFPAEGLVGRPSIPLLTRLGRRIIVKIKTCDYQQLENKRKQFLGEQTK